MDGTSVVIAALAAGSAFCIGTSLVPARNPIAARLQQLDGITERSASKRLQRIDEIIGAERRSSMRDRLNAAGWYHVSPAALALRGIGGMLGGLAVALTAAVFLPNKALVLPLAVMLVLIGWRTPKIMLDRAIKERRRSVARDLPDFLDLLAATVRAGLALSGALVQAAEAATGPLREELQSTLAEIRIGRPRTAALQAMADRIGEVQVRTLVTAIVQAERLGANISTVLHELASENRNRRWMEAEERAAKLPVKMTIPMALLMLPSLYLMIFGPIVARMAAK